MLAPTQHKIIIGDSRNMQELPPESADLMITSPPYWQLKDYGAGGQIGYHDSYEQYINHLNLVWKESHRVLKEGCRLCVNIGDLFARAVFYGRYKVIPIRAEIIKFCEAVGFDYMGAIIWQKQTTSNPSGGGSLMGSYPYPKNGILSIDYEFILIFKKPGAAAKPSAAAREMSKMTKEEWKTFFSGHWNFAGARQEGHLAAFPEELPRRLIKMFSFAGETVLDPFLGSGTTSLAARNLGRHSIGYEISEKFIEIIKGKLESAGELLAPAEYDIIRQTAGDVNYDSEISRLPYVFKDFHGVDLKTDPKKFSFGSKIDEHSPSAREAYDTVREVISPTLVKLGSGLTVRLIGVKENKRINGEAVAFLRRKTAGQKVFLRYDSVKHDADNNLLAYLYLKNRTFINAHLIKKGLAEVDTSYAYAHQEKFMNLEVKRYDSVEECGGIETTSDYWDCECEEDYIHRSASEQICPRCGFRRDEMPDSRLPEVLALGLPVS